VVASRSSDVFKKGWTMARNTVQFQKGLSEPEFDRHYGTEAKCRDVVIGNRCGEAAAYAMRARVGIMPSSAE
jgi:hypothetical protein